jgi:hypothetical protein
MTRILYSVGVKRWLINFFPQHEHELKSIHVLADDYQTKEVTERRQKKWVNQKSDFSTFRMSEMVVLPGAWLEMNHVLGNCD